ncbi:MAG: inositol monophosphatase [Gemmatimonadetes bacterium]|nr:inositol monophosphatase [Gemmatimonadota bacterium]
MEALELQAAAERIAREAGDILRSYVGKSFDVRRKGDVDLVTEADGASEEHIVSFLRREFPEHSILAEEGGASGDRGAEFQWVVDPLDGTTNFAHGLPLWSVSIGLLRHGEPYVGVVHDPSRGECFSAARGHGTACNGVPVRVSRVTALEEALLVTGFPYDIRTSSVNNLDHFRRFMLRSRAVRRLGSAALDLGYVACGRFDAFWELKLHPWDVAAGALLVREAGGAVTRFDGAPFDVFSPELLAGPPDLLPAMSEILLKGNRPESESAGT